MGLKYAVEATYSGPLRKQYIPCRTRRAVQTLVKIARTSGAVDIQVHNLTTYIEKLVVRPPQGS